MTLTLELQPMTILKTVKAPILSPTIQIESDLTAKQVKAIRTVFELLPYLHPDYAVEGLRLNCTNTMTGQLNACPDLAMLQGKGKLWIYKCDAETGKLENSPSVAVITLRLC